MMTKLRMAVAPLLALTMTAAPMAPVAAQQTYQGRSDVHYAKTEVEKAAGKCKATLIGGALGGALLGGILGGRRGLGLGALGGAAAGGAACAVIMANAKHRDKIIQAELAAASSPNGSYTGSWTDDQGKPVIFTAQAGAARQIDGARLVPVRYQGADGVEKASPVLDTGGRDCEVIGGSFAGATGNVPQQTVCRTPQGDYEPYEETKA